MGTVHPAITPPLARWIGEQHLFFVATAPSGGGGHVNVSPKGLDTLRLLDDHRVAYLDLTGSGAETIAHIRENGRITLMWCAFTGPPRVVRVHGHGEVVDLDDPRFEGLFPALPGARAIIAVTATRIADSCGYAVPLYAFEGDRERLIEWAERRGDEGLREYWDAHNRRSIDGLPALDS